MVVKADGSKWACQSCLKGHRVSGCTHTDRDLILVPKKGRPVTQCQHCRAERKKRSAHVSCDCGELDKTHHPKEKCIHLREAEEKTKLGLVDEHDADRGVAHLIAVAEEQGCCCHHGGKCTCAILKKDIDRDNDATPPHGPAVKPRLDTSKSDGSTTIFQNGHHKPVHRKNHLAHECGMPYKMPVSRTHSDHPMSAKARRSVDSLALDHATSSKPSSFTPLTSPPFHTERRMSKSEQPSPKIFSADTSYSSLGDSNIGPIDFSTLAPVQTNQSMQTTTSDVFVYTPLDPMAGMQDNVFDPWSAVPSAGSSGMPNNNPFGVWPTNPDVSCMAQPALTAASSGTQSEIDEIPAMDDAYGFAMPSIAEDTGAFNYDVPQAGSPQNNRHSLPANFFKGVSIGAEWSRPFEVGVNNQQKPYDTPGSFDFQDLWLQGSNMPPITDAPGRDVALPISGRPSSRSVGPGNLPNTNILQSLFPDLEVNNNAYFGSPSVAQEFTASTYLKLPMAEPAEYELPDAEMVFRPQAWSDGSMSIPNDTYASSFDVTQDFSNPDLSANWTQ